MDFHDSLARIRAEVEEQLNHNVPAEQVRQEALGRKGALTAVLRSIAGLPESERSAAGAAANDMKKEVERRLEEAVPGQPQPDQAGPFDRSVPPFPLRSGTVHPVSAMIFEMVSIFSDLSFEVVEGNELVSEKENFESLNIDKDHPARDGHDSFYLRDNLLLRTHTTSAQVIEMNRRVRRNALPLRVVVPGKTYRRESDATHSPMFHQFDAVMVDTQTTFSDLKGILHYFANRLFGDSVETRFRPHFFPFTEPSAEIDIRWKGGSQTQGKHTDWLEFGGCGMIHPQVLKRAGIDPRVYQGWAFGMAVERPIMVRQQVPDLRRFFDNSINFLNQFGENL